MVALIVLSWAGPFCSLCVFTEGLKSRAAAPAGEVGGESLLGDLVLRPSLPDWSCRHLPVVLAAPSFLAPFLWGTSQSGGACMSRTSARGSLGRDAGLCLGSFWGDLGSANPSLASVSSSIKWQSSETSLPGWLWGFHVMLLLGSSGCCH